MLGWVKSLSSSLLSATFFPAVLPLTSISLLAAPFSPEAPWEVEEDSSTTLCPAWGVAWTVLHIINLGITQTHPHKTIVSCIHVIDPHFQRFHSLLSGIFTSCLYWPAAVAEGEEEHTEDDAGDSDVDADYDACSGRFALLIFHTVARGVQHWGDTAQLTVTAAPKFNHEKSTLSMTVVIKRWHTINLGCTEVMSDSM